MFQRLMRRANRESQVIKNWQIEINLLPREYLPQSPYSLQNTSFLVLSFLIVGFLMIDVLQITHREKALDQYLNVQVLNELQKFGTRLVDMRRLKEQTAILHERRNLLAEVINRRTTWSDKLSQVYAQIPSDVWLSEISVKRDVFQIPVAKEKQDQQNKPTPATPQQESPKQIVLHISGMAKDLARIAEFIARLEALPFLDNIRFNSSKQTEQDDQFVMSFEIIARVNTAGNTQL